MNPQNSGEALKIQVFMISEKDNYNAVGSFDGTGITVHKGSTVSQTHFDADQHSDAVTPDGLLKEDTYFRSPNAAAQFVCGRSANGWVEWKTATGTLFQAYAKSTPTVENEPKEKAADTPKLRVRMISERANYNASGSFNGTGILVHKGSKVSLTVTYARLDAQQRAAAVTPDGILKEDIYFDSPSAAAQFVCGRSANGWVEWKTETDTPLQAYRDHTPAKSVPTVETEPKEKPAPVRKADKANDNMVGLEGVEITIEVDALAEEQDNARGFYDALHLAYQQEEKKLTYPDVKPYDTAWDPEDIKQLQHKKETNQPVWEDMKKIRSYLNADELYSGHVQYTNGGNRYFTESLETRDWLDQKGPFLINVDDRRYKAELDAWHYPGNNTTVAFSRNITMQDKKVTAVDIVLDRSDSVYANITDNYLRNALKRNKDKKGTQSIIQTIQKKQDDIRSKNPDAAFVVQGCAGSGKTMVLLHRLRYLLYNRELYSEDYYFLVPSTGFKKYIRDVAAKFNITYGNILSYQKYYKMLLDKPDMSQDEEVSELIFPADYLSRVYSREFMQLCYGRLFSMIAEQTNALTEICEEKLNALLAGEEEKINTTIASARENALAEAVRHGEKIARHLGVELTAYEHIAALISEMEALYNKQKELLSDPALDGENISVDPEDSRVLADERLQAMNAEIQAEAEHIRKASIFTVNSHKKKQNQLIENRDAYLKEVLSRILEEEKQLRAQEQARLSVIFEDVTIQVLENARSEIQKAYTKAQQICQSEEKKRESITETIAAAHKDGIAALTDLIEGSGDLTTRAAQWIKELIPAGEYLKEYIRKGTTLCAAFGRYMGDKQGQEDFREKFKLFARRTEKEQAAYLGTLLMNICRKQIKEEFSVKICDIYKHYWYIRLYCHYLLSGPSGKARTHLFIDEAQDLSVSELELIRKLNKYPKLNLFGDINQVITDHGIRDWDGASGGLEIIVLDENFRNTNQIVEFCNGVLPFKMQKIGVDMDEVEQYETVDKAINAGSLADGSTVIVKDVCASEDAVLVLKNAKLENVKVYTVKEAKGLEFREVTVIDRDMTDNEKYISYTRAMAKLSVIHSLPAFADPAESRIVEGEEEEAAE